MAYDREKIFEQAKEVIIKNNLIFIEDIVAFLPIAKKTFYEYFPIDSNESNDLKGLLDTNKVTLKVSMRSKWYESDSPALQMGLMKLLSNSEELRKLSMTHNAVEEVKSIPILNIDPLSNDTTDDSDKENI
jgi:hypothetical protein